MTRKDLHHGQVEQQELHLTRMNKLYHKLDNFIIKSFPCFIILLYDGESAVLHKMEVDLFLIFLIYLIFLVKKYMIIIVSLAKTRLKPQGISCYTGSRQPICEFSISAKLPYLSELYGIGHQHRFIYRFFASVMCLVIISRLCFF